MASHKMLSHRQLCVQQKIILFFSCLCDPISHLLPSEVHEWKRPAKYIRNEKVERHPRSWMSNIFPDDFHLRCAHSPHLVFTVFQLLMNNDLIRSYACLALCWRWICRLMDYVVWVHMMYVRIYCMYILYNSLCRHVYPKCCMTLSGKFCPHLNSDCAQYYYSTLSSRIDLIFTVWIATYIA